MLFLKARGHKATGVTILLFTLILKKYVTCQTDVRNGEEAQNNVIIIQLWTKSEILCMSCLYSCEVAEPDGKCLTELGCVWAQCVPLVCIPACRNNADAVLFLVK